MSKFVSYNANPDGNRAGNCVVRAISAATGRSWDETMIRLCVWSIILHDMPSADRVWGAYLRSLGFAWHIIPDDCPDGYTVADFCADHPDGMFILAISGNISGHVVYINDGQYFDSWDSGGEIPLYYWEKEIK